MGHIQNMTTEVPIFPSIQSFLSRDQRLLIGGRWLPAQSGETFETINPATGQALCRVASGDTADVDAAVKAAQAAFEAWAGMMPAQRERLLHRLADLMEQHKDELAQLETLDNGKPYRVAYNVEVNVAIGQMRYYAGLPTKLKGETYAVSSPC